MALDHHRAVATDRRNEVGILVLQPARQGGGAAVDEALGEAVVQGVRQPVLDAAGTLLAVQRIVDPVAAVGDVGPGPDVGDAGGQGIDVTVGAVEAPDLLVDPRSEEHTSELQSLMRNSYAV